MLKVINATKFYKNHKVLENISFSLTSGKIVALAGPSGSGKSTLLRCIQGLEQLDGGEIQHQVKTGFVFQDFQLFPHFNVLKNVTYPLQVTKKYSLEKSQKKAKETLETLGLKGEFIHKMPHQLSGGQRQRAAIARALVINPDLLLCDEPTSGLDGVSGKKVADLFLKLKEQGVSMLIASHDLEFLSALADRIVVLNNAQLVKDISLDQNQDRLTWKKLLG